MNNNFDSYGRMFWGNRLVKWKKAEDNGHLMPCGEAHGIWGGGVRAVLSPSKKQETQLPATLV